MNRSKSAAARGFSLIELLVVIAIIALIISIVVPAIGSARKSARKADSINLVNGLSQSISQYVLDQRRLPGYFPPKVMGQQDNNDAGFSNTENVLLDLCGGIAPDNSQSDDILDVGPITGQGVRVRPGLIGTAQGSAKAYFTPKAKNFEVQDGVNPNGGNRASNANNRRMPVLVDSDGMPILIWTADESVTKVPASANEFRDPLRSPMAASWVTAGFSARFYWVSNSAFLRDGGSPLVGKKRINQSEESVFGSDVPAYTANLAAFVGNPNTPVPFTAATTDPAQIYPSATRGSFIIQSAGTDGVYMGKNDRGGKRRADGVLYYGDNFLPAPGADFIRDFDDIIISGS